MTFLIIQGNFKGIGFDVMGLDPLRDNNLNRHKALFKDTDIVNIENLTNLDQCGDELFWFSCFEYIKIDRDKSTFKSHRDFSSEIEITFKHL